MSALSDLHSRFYKLAANYEHPTSIEVEAKDYAMLLVELEGLSRYITEPMPEAPISSRSSYSEGGFFSWGAGSNETRDYHAPAYLDALKKWQDTQEARSKEPQKLVMWAPWGQVEIKVRK